jgi:uncharacterized short protein YbdD (DUF466 family)
MRAACCPAAAWFRRVWAALRAWSGDSAYETYVARARVLGVVPVSAQDFYLEAVRKRYSNVGRCC